MVRQVLQVLGSDHSAGVIDNSLLVRAIYAYKMKSCVGENEVISAGYCFTRLGLLV